MYGSGALVLEKVKASAEIVAMLLKSWSGELRSGLAKLRHRLLTAIASPAQVSSTSTSTEGRRSRRWLTLCRTSLLVSASVELTDPVLRAKEADDPLPKTGCPARHVARRLQRPMQNN